MGGRVRQVDIIDIRLGGTIGVLLHSYGIQPGGMVIIYEV